MLKRDIKNSEREFYGSVFPQEFAKVYSGKKYTMLFLAWRPKKKHGIFWPEYTLANSIGNTGRQILQRNFKCHVFTHNMPEVVFIPEYDGIFRREYDLSNIIQISDWRTSGQNMTS